MWERVCFAGVYLFPWQFGSWSPLVSGILSMYGIFLLSFLIMPYDWELIMA